MIVNFAGMPEAIMVQDRAMQKAIIALESSPKEIGRILVDNEERGLYTMLISRDGTLAQGAPREIGLGEDGLIGSRTDSLHKDIRGATQPIFGRNAIESQESVSSMNNHIRKAVAAIPAGEEVEILDYIRDGFYTVLLRDIMGYNGDLEGVIDAPGLVNTMTIRGGMGHMFSALPNALLDVLASAATGESIKKTRQRLQETADRIIKDTRDREGTFVNLLETAAKENDYDIDFRKVTALTLELIAAGQDTTTQLISNTYDALYYKPDVIDNILAEYQQFIAENEETLGADEALRQFLLRDDTVLYATILESLRRFPITATLPFKATHDMTMTVNKNGKIIVLPIKEGQHILLNLDANALDDQMNFFDIWERYLPNDDNYEQWSQGYIAKQIHKEMNLNEFMQLDSNDQMQVLYKSLKADEFNPYRWFSDGKLDANIIDRIPFLTGVRTCLGVSLANMTAKSMLLELLKQGVRVTTPGESKVVVGVRGTVDTKVIKTVKG